MSDLFPFDHFLKPQNKSNINNLPINKGAQNIQNESEVIENFKQNIPPKKYNSLFDGTLKLIENKPELLIFEVPNESTKSTLENKFMDELKEACFDTFQKDKKIQIRSLDSKTQPNKGIKSILDPSIQAKEKRSVRDHKFKLDLDPTEDDLKSKIESTYINHMNPDPQELIIDNQKRFENFIIGASNQLAFATAQAVSKNPGKDGKYPSLYLHSNSGLGKTHLLHAVANQIKENYPQLIICLITARDFMNEMISHIQKNDIAEFRRKYSEKVDVLMIDDIHELKSKQGTQNEFFHIFNELHNKGKQLIFTSDKSPKEIDGIEERIKTRLQWGLVVDIQKPDIETRIAILKRKAQELDLYCTEDVINLIATSVKSSIRELEGSLIRLSAYADVMGIEIDAEIVKEQLNIQDNTESKQITLESIGKVTSQHFKIPLPDLRSKSRNKEIAYARHVAIYLSRKLIRATQQDIGKYYGGRDHTSIIHAEKKVQELLKTDSKLSRHLLEIENTL
ncbi:MAG: chromosomal replication initiator protein DnaA [Bacteriovoracaceae bacterium]